MAKIDYDVGDVVVCVDDKSCWCCGDAMPFKVGDLDRVTSIKDYDGELYMDSPLFGLPTANHPLRGCGAHRFRKLLPADDSFKQLLKSLRSKVDA